MCFFVYPDHLSAHLEFIWQYLSRPAINLTIVVIADVLFFRL
ncbi:hypothetical protein PRABACTJOHN_01098 [Parabacteroides johnsonii DSM 18315]|uniref:Uncharacterized protein n=1 Tax=Parabacteroides johnsonii DSM 18315 TaxID=537006 RepID=B7B7U8_9BACT|nr:hypothetical protein PRABACTJOHN_01098 [Parabacteroides johnsonii DSM 18315]